MAGTSFVSGQDDVAGGFRMSVRHKAICGNGNEGMIGKTQDNTRDIGNVPDCQMERMERAEFPVIIGDGPEV